MIEIQKLFNMIPDVMNNKAAWKITAMDEDRKRGVACVTKIENKFVECETASSEPLVDKFNLVDVD